MEGGQYRPNLANIRPDLGPHRANSGRIRTNLAFGATLIRRCHSKTPPRAFFDNFSSRAPSGGGQQLSKLVARRTVAWESTRRNACGGIWGAILGRRTPTFAAMSSGGGLAGLARKRAQQPLCARGQNTPKTVTCGSACGLTRAPSSTLAMCLRSSRVASPPHQTPFLSAL